MSRFKAAKPLGSDGARDTAKGSSTKTTKALDITGTESKALRLLRA